MVLNPVRCIENCSTFCDGLEEYSAIIISPFTRSMNLFVHLFFFFIKNLSVNKALYVVLVNIPEYKNPQLWVIHYSAVGDECDVSTQN